MLYQKWLPSATLESLISTAEPDNKCGAFCLTTFYYLLLFIMTKEITLDDIIEFIIRHRNDTEMMDEISKASFPFTSKYRNKNDWEKNSTITLTPY